MFAQSGTTNYPSSPSHDHQYYSPGTQQGLFVQDITAVVPGSPLGLSPLDGQPDYGNDAGIQLQNPRYITIKHRAKFASICCDQCNSDKQRQFFFVTENSLFMNFPSACALNCCGSVLCSLPPNGCCPGQDHTTHIFFDRGIFDRQSCCWSLGVFRGKEAIVANETKMVCLFNDCPVIGNQIAACYFPGCCGERVRYLSHETCCFCVPTRANWCCNSCGFCGIKEGEPLPICLLPVAAHLKEGEAEVLVQSFTKAREEWGEYSNKKINF